MALNLLGLELKVAVNKDPPYFDFEEINGTLLVKEGLEVKILQTFTKKFNFTHKLINCNQSWGSRFENNNTWTGIFGQLDKKLADFGISELSITEERSEYFKFSYPHIISTITFITSPPKLHSKLYALAHYFDEQTWIYFNVTIITMVLLMYLIAKLIETIKFNQLLWLSLEAAMKQSIEIHRIPSQNSFKVFFLFWLLFSFIFSTFYANCIYSLMVFPLTKKSIDTIEELYQEKVKGHIRVCIQEDTSTFSELEDSHIYIYRELSKSMEFFKNDEEAIYALTHTDMPKALITSREYLNYVSSKYDQDAYYVPPHADETTFFLDFIAIAYRKDFQYIREFDKLILAIKEAGLFDFWMLVLQAKYESSTDEEEQTSAFDLGVGNFSLYFHLLFCGSVLSCSILLIEILLKYITYRYKKPHGQIKQSELTKKLNLRKHKLNMPKATFIYSCDLNSKK